MDNNLYSYPTPQSGPKKGRKKRTLLIAAIVVIIVLILVLAGYELHRSSGNQLDGNSINSGSSSESGQATGNGTLQFSYGSLSTSDITVMVNSKTLAGSDILKDYLQPGSYTITVAKPGYQQFNATVAVVAGQTTEVNIVLQPSPNAANSAPQKITSWSQLTPNAANSFPDNDDDGQTSTSDYLGVQITQTTYFDSNSWAVIQANMYGQSTVSVAQYNTSGKDWVIVAGPVSGSITPSNLGGVPADVVTYLQGHGFLYPAGD